MGSVFGDGDGSEPGNDTINVSGGTIDGTIFADAGDDQVTVSGGTVEGSVLGGDGDDKVTVSGGTIKGGINAETVQLNGGTILGDITGLSENTLIIQAENLSLRDGVLFQGTNVVGTVTGTNILSGSINFAGFSSVTLDGQSTLRLAPGVQQIASLQVLDGSTLQIAGPGQSGFAHRRSGQSGGHQCDDQHAERQSDGCLQRRRYLLSTMPRSRST